MGFKCGIIGLPNAGKSTIFTALSSRSVPAESYPFCTIEPNLGRIKIKDDRLERLAEIIDPDEVIPNTLDFVDIAGLVKGASEGEGLGNKFLTHIRNVDAVIHVVRCFKDKNIPKPTDDSDPVSDIKTVENEILLKDLETVSKAYDKARKAVKGGGKEERERSETLENLLEHLEESVPLREIELKEKEQKLAEEFALLTAKPALYVANYGDDDDKDEQRFIRRVEEYAEQKNAGCLTVNGKLEAEILELNPEEREEMLEAMNKDGSALEDIIRAGYELLDLITFFTTNYEELRAWTAEAGTKAPEAAGKIHTDIREGFIKAEVVKYEDIDRFGSLKKIREEGLLHIEGKDYPVQDGDLIQFKFQEK